MDRRVFAMLVVGLALSTPQANAQTAPNAPAEPSPAAAPAPAPEAAAPPPAASSPAPATPPVPVVAATPAPPPPPTQLSDDDKAYVRGTLRTAGCTFVEITGTVITATCANAAGDQVESKLETLGCNDKDLKVVEGSLACIGRPLNVQRAPRKVAAAPAAPPAPPPPASTIVLYSKARFEGRKTPEISQTVADLADLDFRNTTASVVIKGPGKWQLCDKVNFGGKCVTLGATADSLLKYGLRNDISSVRPAK